MDSAGDLTVDSTSVVFDTMRCDANSYVYKDFGAGFFGDITFDFELQITDSNYTSEVLLFALSNTIGTLEDHKTANDGIALWASGTADPNIQFYYSAV